MSANPRQSESSLQSTHPIHELAPIEELRQRQRELRALVNVALTLMLLLSVAVNLLVGKQWRMVRTRVAEARPSVQRMTADFAMKEPGMRKFVSALQSYAFTNADFQPILAKYSNALPQYFVTPARAPATASRGTLVPPLAPSAK